MKTDLRQTELYLEAQALYTSLRQPGAGQISEAAQVHASPDSRLAAFAGTIVGELIGNPPTRICVTDLATGDTRVLTDGPNVDQSPRFSPDSRYIGFLSDRREAGDFQLYLIEVATGMTRAAPTVSGWIEYLHWSPDGSRILLGVADHGADVCAGSGAVTSTSLDLKRPAWMPAVDIGDGADRWRSLWIYDMATNRVARVSRVGTNIWEGAWCGNKALVAVVSFAPTEGSWYGSVLQLIELNSSSVSDIHRPQDQLGVPASSPSGRYVLVVEALCSDRGFVAGDLRMIDTSSGRVSRVNTHGVDVTHVEWRSEQTVLVAGHRGLETVVAVYDTASEAFTETWSSVELSAGDIFAVVSGFGGGRGDCVLIAEGFNRAPELGVIQDGQYRSIKSFDLGYAQQAQVLDGVERISWLAPDGLEIQGWLLRPYVEGPTAVVSSIHGGPVWHWRPMWLGCRSAHALMLIKRGYAIFLPNPRGSTGRGQSFARRVLGDMGGADTHDHLWGLDHLVQAGFADPRRLGVMGGSYGGFMASWLVTQDARFGAAVAVSPVTNHVTQHLLSNIPQFVSLFLSDTYASPGGKYFHRSPIMHASKVKTPVLSICGLLDRCTPAEEAMQFHRSLLENAVTSALVTYPEEGHGVRRFPALIDYAARVVGWFQKYVPTG